MNTGSDSLDGVDPQIDAQLSSEQRQMIRRCLMTLGTLGVGSMIGGTSFLYLVNNFPLLLIALSPIGRHLILVAPIVHPAAFIAVAVSRRMLFYGPSFLLGRALGPYGIVWLEKRAPALGRFFRFLERIFAKAPRTVVFFLPGPSISTIAGASQMDPRVFAPLIATGLVVRMALLLALAEWARAPLEAVLAWIDDNWVPGTIAIVLGVLVYQIVKRRRADSAADSSTIDA